MAPQESFSVRIHSIDAEGRGQGHPLLLFRFFKLKIEEVWIITS